MPKINTNNFTRKKTTVDPQWTPSNSTLQAVKQTQKNKQRLTRTTDSLKQPTKQQRLNCVKTRPLSTQYISKKFSSKIRWLPAGDNLLTEIILKMPTHKFSQIAAEITTRIQQSNSDLKNFVLNGKQVREHWNSINFDIKKITANQKKIITDYIEQKIKTTPHFGKDIANEIRSKLPDTTLSYDFLKNRWHSKLRAINKANNSTKTVFSKNSLDSSKRNMRSSINSAKNNSKTLNLLNDTHKEFMDFMDDLFPEKSYTDPLFIFDNEELHTKNFQISEELEQEISMFLLLDETN